MITLGCGLQLRVVIRAAGATEGQPDRSHRTALKPILHAEHSRVNAYSACSDLGSHEAWHEACYDMFGGGARCRGGLYELLRARRIMSG